MIPACMLLALSGAYWERTIENFASNMLTWSNNGEMYNKPLHLYDWVFFF